MKKHVVLIVVALVFLCGGCAVYDTAPSVNETESSMSEVYNLNLEQDILLKKEQLSQKEYNAGLSQEEKISDLIDYIGLYMQYLSDSENNAALLKKLVHADIFSGWLDITCDSNGDLYILLRFNHPYLASYSKNNWNYFCFANNKEVNILPIAEETSKCYQNVICCTESSNESRVVFEGIDITAPYNSDILVSFFAIGDGFLIEQRVKENSLFIVDNNSIIIERNQYQEVRLYTDGNDLLAKLIPKNLELASQIISIYFEDGLVLTEQNA